MPDVRANKARLLDDVFGRMVNAIAADRTRTGKRISAGDVRTLVDRGLFMLAQAQAAGLIDGIADQGELEMVIARALGRPDVGITDLETAPVAPARGRDAASPSCWSTAPSSTGRARSCRSASVGWRTGLLARGAGGVQGRFDRRRGRPARQQPGRLGVRVRRDRARRPADPAAGKPVIVSMGDTAASGGYYMAAPADVIFAQPSTITGSIGIFVVKVNAAELVNMLGINVETNRRGAHADYLSPYRPWKEADEDGDGQDAVPLRPVRRDCRRRARVARADHREGRRRRARRGVDRRAHQSVGLVDKLGGLGDAIDEAVRRAASRSAATRFRISTSCRARRSAWWRRLAGAADGTTEGGARRAAERGLPALLTPDLRAALRMLAPTLLGGGSGYQARMPYDIEMR